MRGGGQGEASRTGKEERQQGAECRSSLTSEEILRALLQEIKGRIKMGLLTLRGPTVALRQLGGGACRGAEKRQGDK